MSDYRKRTRASIVEHCERRGIPKEEAPSVIAEIEKAVGTPLAKMHDGELKRVNRNLSTYLVAYLGGKKRRAGGPPGPPPGSGQATAGGAVDIK